MQSQIFPTKPTAGKVDELEALLTAQRLSFLASSTTTGLTGSLHEAIADFRAALNPRSHVAASPALSRLEVPNQVPAYTKDSEAPTKAGELDMETPMPCVCSESAMASELAKHLEAVQAKSANEIGRLVDIIMELKMEFRDLRATMETFKLDPSSQDHYISPNTPKVPHFDRLSSRSTTPGLDAAHFRAASPSVRGIQCPPSPIQYSAAHVSGGIMSPVPIQIAAPRPPTPRWVDNRIQANFTTKQASLGQISPRPSRVVSPSPGWVSVSPIPAVSTECYPGSPIPVDPHTALVAAPSPPPTIVPETVTACEAPQAPEEKHDETSKCTCRTEKSKVKSKGGGRKWKTIKKKIQCADCFAKENAKVEPAPVDGRHSSHPTPVQPPMPEIPCSSPQHTGLVTLLPESGVPTLCLATNPVVISSSPAVISSSPVVLNSFPVVHAAGLVLSGPLPEDPATSIHASVPCSVTTLPQPPVTLSQPSPSLPYVSKESILPLNARQVATALNSFLTLQNDELAFERGDTIVVFDTPANPTGWLLGQHSSGRTGLFPARYVKLAA